MSTIAPRDLAALQALRDAMMACNAAHTSHLHYQDGGAFGLTYDAFINAATALLGDNRAKLLMDIVIDSGEDVAYCLDYIAKNHAPQPLDDKTLDILAWDISDAIAKTVDDHGMDLGMDEIKVALPAFFARVIGNAAKGN